jgi:LCP family protein required for cell wall assembly
MNTQYPNPGIPVDLSLVNHPVLTTDSPARKRTWRWWLLAILVFLLFFTPMRTTVLILGIDRPPEGTWAGRSDTMILTSITPVLPDVSILSIPRDLWVNVPGQGENRINTAHYFAEISAPGTGKAAADGVVEANLGVNVDYVVRIKFDGFVKIIDAMGGVTVTLPVAMSGLAAGEHTFDGSQALAFVRDRSGSDDFFRQQRGQMVILAGIKNMMSPAKWARLPAVLVALLQSVDTNIPIWIYPRLIYASLFSAVKGFDARTFDRDMVTSWTTDAGAQVLIPNWDRINPLLFELFRQ